jgi:hypothetical protein
VQFSNTGRPTDVLCCWRPQHSQLLHEVLLTAELIRFPRFRVRRGKFVDQQIRPDATMLVGDGASPVHWEFDNSTENYARVKERLQVYLRRREPVIWVARTESRLDGIWKRAKALGDRAFFKIAGADVLYGHDGTEYGLDVFPGPGVPY